jgi:hypothetical protein
MLYCFTHKAALGSINYFLYLETEVMGESLKEAVDIV